MLIVKMIKRTLLKLKPTPKRYQHLEPESKSAHVLRDLGLD
ncbi:hypothetical protein VITU102760_19285 [Vibrio tubiashii]|jgi:hypothetical protein